MLHPMWNSRYIIHRQLRPDPVMSMVFLDLSGNPTWQWIWLVVEPTPLKNMLVRSRQLGLLFTIYGKYSCSKPPSSIIMGVLPVQFSFCSYPECHRSIKCQNTWFHDIICPTLMVHFESSTNNALSWDCSKRMVNTVGSAHLGHQERLGMLIWSVHAEVS